MKWDELFAWLGMLLFIAAFVAPFVALVVMAP